MNSILQRLNADLSLAEVCGSTLQCRLLRSAPCARRKKVRVTKAASKYRDFRTSRCDLDRNNVGEIMLGYIRSLTEIFSNGIVEIDEIEQRSLTEHGGCTVSQAMTGKRDNGRQ